jgi:hypothetical protein
MRTVTGPAGSPNRGRWVWVLAGLVTAGALVIPGAKLFDSAGVPVRPQPQATATLAHAVPTPASSPGGGSMQGSSAPGQVTASARP